MPPSAIVACRRTSSESSCKAATSAGIEASARLLLEFLDQLRRLGLGHLVRDLLAGLLGEGVHVRILGAGHRLVTGFPLLGILDRTAILGGLFLLRHGLTSSTMSRSASKS